MSADNYWLCTKHPTLGWVASMQFASDDGTEEEKIVQAVTQRRYEAFQTEQEMDDYMGGSWTEYGECWVDWPLEREQP